MNRFVSTKNRLILISELFIEVAAHLANYAVKFEENYSSILKFIEKKGIKPEFKYCGFEGFCKDY